MGECRRFRAVQDGLLPGNLRHMNLHRMHLRDVNLRHVNLGYGHLRYVDLLRHVGLLWAGRRHAVVGVHEASE